MKTWEYRHALYNGQHVEPYFREWSGDDNAVVGPMALPDFLSQAGLKGWEMCGAVPYPSANPNGDLALILKRPIP